MGLINCFLILFATAFLAGCGTIGNIIIGPEQGFRDYMDSKVGKPINSIIDPNNMAKNFGESVVKIDDKFDEYTVFFIKYRKDDGNCYIAAKVERSTAFIVNWKYVSNPSYCKKDKFYSGAW